MSRRKMRAYEVYGEVVGTKHLGRVFAYSKEEAEQAARELPDVDVSFCNYCASECDDAQIQEIRVEEAPDAD